MTNYTVTPPPAGRFRNGHTKQARPKPCRTGKRRARMNHERADEKQTRLKPSEGNLARMHAPPPPPPHLSRGFPHGFQGVFSWITGNSTQETARTFPIPKNRLESTAMHGQKATMRPTTLPRAEPPWLRLSSITPPPPPSPQTTTASFFFPTGQPVNGII